MDPEPELGWDGVGWGGHNLLSLLQSTALAIKSCRADSPFPAHPGTAECCAQQGLERKLCLAALRHPPQPLPRYLQPSDKELCQAFRQDPQEFADR